MLGLIGGGGVPPPGSATGGKKKTRFRQRLYNKIGRNPISFRSPLLRKCRIVLDSGFHAVDSGSLSKELGFWIPIVSRILDSLSWIQDSKTLGLSLHKQKLFAAIPCCGFSTFLISFTENDGFFYGNITGIVTSKWFGSLLFFFKCMDLMTWRGRYKFLLETTSVDVCLIWYDREFVLGRSKRSQ